MRTGGSPLRDCCVRVQARYQLAEGALRLEPLRLLQTTFSHMDAPCQCWHRLDEHSPLWEIRDTLETSLHGLEARAPQKLGEMDGEM